MYVSFDKTVCKWAETRPRHTPTVTVPVIVSVEWIHDKTPVDKIPTDKIPAHYTKVDKTPCSHVNALSSILPYLDLHTGLGKYGHITLHFLSVFQPYSPLFITSFLFSLHIRKSVCSHVTCYKHNLVIHNREEETQCFVPATQPFIRNSRRYSLSIT